ncbi:4Fe-4S dicluster domain-containing protein [uncultured Methanofollis sp.]|uniref:4Fe-4S dicluster domain-containing protein n=1 Tax=uncultured Methanofollis sp. TaxID=262500 RepID=UPI0026167630|nr:4Fe-4S dicluster domain-containing protein [uncultured Methanofollis sp.]
MENISVRPEFCIGCRHCEFACAVEHTPDRDLFTAASAGKIVQPRMHVRTGTGTLTIPDLCRHCTPAPCMEACPTDALYRDTGSVLVDEDLCTGCAVCARACPFGNVPPFSADRRVNTKCDNCIERRRNGMVPACVEACKTGALVLGGAPGPHHAETTVPANIRAYRAVLKKIAGFRNERKDERYHV